MCKLFWITEVEKGEDDHRYLGGKSSLSYCGKGSHREPATLENTTLTELADYCDQEAGGANYHHLVGVHHKLAKMMEEKSSEVSAKSVMFEIASAGGLHEFND